MATCQEWYKVLRLKKVEVVAQLTARQIAFKLSQHHMTLKSLLYKATKAIKSLLQQFQDVIKDDWTKAWKQSGKSLKDYKKGLLRVFHPDLNTDDVEEATTICQTINSWEEEQELFSFSTAGSRARDYWRATLSKEEFLEVHNLFTTKNKRQARGMPERFTNAYLASWISYSDYDFFTGEPIKDVYRGQKFTYVAPYTEEYEDGTVSTEEDDFGFVDAVFNELFKNQAPVDLPW